MIKIRFTYPLLFALLLAALIYLARDPGPRQPAPARRSTRRMPLHREGTTDFVIDQARPAGDDYDAQTERLDRDAAERGRAAFEQTARPFEEAKERLNARHEQRQSRYARR